MYVPQHFSDEDRDSLDRVIRDNPFGLLVGTVDGAPFATHLPFLLDGDRLLGHVARGNPHWRAIDGKSEMLAVFSGPHAYVSPRWYAPGPAVPTWNYVAVHVYGAPRIIGNAASVRDLLDRLVGEYEAGAWTLDRQDAGYVDRMMRGIVAFEMPLARIEGKFKLSQNRPAEDRRRVAAELAQSDRGADRQVGRLMADREVAE
ncbi:MAG: FMN-binding negative transcriptional regulator [Gammaproteobacteria bacterium]|nr:FMN-binding negative transcriptional regulator [Gammaproteobacteria bacterium]